MKFRLCLTPGRFWSPEALASINDGKPHRHTSGSFEEAPAFLNHTGHWQEFEDVAEKPTATGDFFVKNSKSSKVYLHIEGTDPGRYARKLVPTGKWYHVGLNLSNMANMVLELDNPGPLPVSQISNRPTYSPVYVEGVCMDAGEVESNTRTSHISGVLILRGNACSVRGPEGGTVYVTRSEFVTLPRCSACNDRFLTALPEGGICQRCEEQAVQRRVRGYHSVPPHGFIKYKVKDEELFLGVEIETDQPQHAEAKRTNAVKLLMRTDPQEKKFYLNGDGSLQCGFEWITMPHSMEKFMEEKQYWTDLLNGVAAAGMRSHDTDTCGQHIHATREAFKPGCVEFISTVYENLYPDFAHFSRRSRSELERWAPRADKARTFGEQKCTATGPYYYGRGALNTGTSRTPTVEFRFFKGTLNPTTFYANLQLVWSMILMGNKSNWRNKALEVTFDDIINFSGFSEIQEYWARRKDQPRARANENY